MRVGTKASFAAVLVLGSIASLPRVCAEGSSDAISATSSEDPSACADRYNALLGQAKASLLNGDRGAAVNSLIAAKLQLRTCQEQEQRNSTAEVAVALNSPRLADVE